MGPPPVLCKIGRPRGVVGMVPSGMPYPAVASHSLQLTLDRWWSYLDFATARTSGASEPTPVFNLLDRGCFGWSWARQEYTPQRVRGDKIRSGDKIRLRRGPTLC